MSTNIRKHLSVATISAGVGAALAAAVLTQGGGISTREIAPAFPELTESVAPATKMPDGTIHAGRSPDTHRPMYATVQDAPLTYTFDRAQAYCADLEAGGTKDWRVPTRDELSVLFQNRAAIGGFDETGHIDRGWYWSSSRSFNFLAWAQRFSDGTQYYFRIVASGLRCVRG